MGKGRCQPITKKENIQLNSTARHVGAEVKISCGGKVVGTVVCLPNLCWNGSIPECLTNNSDSTGGIDYIGLFYPCLLLFCLTFICIVALKYSARRDKDMTAVIVEEILNPAESEESLTDCESKGDEINDNPPQYFTADLIPKLSQTEDSGIKDMFSFETSFETPQNCPVRHTIGHSDETVCPPNGQDSQETQTRFTEIVIPDLLANSKPNSTIVFIDGPTSSQSSKQAGPPDH